MRWFWLCLLSLAVGCLSPATAQIKDTESDITGVRRVMSESLRDITIQKYAGNDAGLLARYEIDTDDGERAWSLSFYGFADSTTSVSAAQQLQIQADGQQVQPLRVESKTRRMDDGTVLEIKTAYFSRSIFERLATAGSMTVSIGAAEFVADERARNDMRLILDKIPPPDARPTASSDDESGS